MVLIKKKDKKILFLAAAVGCFLTATQGIAVSDSFLNPADNAYSLKKVFVRPSLQNSPIPQVWQTDAKSAEFRRARLDAMTPRTAAERQLNALSWQSDVRDGLNDIKKITTENPAQDWEAIGQMLRDIIPIVEQAEQNAVFGFDVQDSLYARDQVWQAGKEIDALTGEMRGFQAFLTVLNETARTDLEVARLNLLMENADSKSDKNLIGLGRFFLTDDLLKKADDIYLTETRQIRELKEMDNVLSSLLINDMMDLATGMVILSDEDEFFKQPIENTRLSSSLLDRAEKTEHLHKIDPVSRRKVFFKRLEKFLKSNKAKDVQ